MGRPKRLYPLGKYRLRTPKVVDEEKDEFRSPMVFVNLLREITASK